MFSFCLPPAEKRHVSLFCTITGCVEIAIQNYGTFRRRAPGCLGAMPLENARGELDLLNPLPMEERDSLTTQQVSQRGVLHTESCLLEGLCFLEGAHSVFPELNSISMSGCQMVFISSANNQQSRSNCLDFEELLVSVFIASEQVDPQGKSCSRHFSFFVLAKQRWFLFNHYWVSMLDSAYVGEI